MRVWKVDDDFFQGPLVGRDGVQLPLPCQLDREMAVNVGVEPHMVRKSLWGDCEGRCPR